MEKSCPLSDVSQCSCPLERREMNNLWSRSICISAIKFLPNNCGLLAKLVRVLAGCGESGSCRRTWMFGGCSLRDRKWLQRAQFQLSREVIVLQCTFSIFDEPISLGVVRPVLLNRSRTFWAKRQKRTAHQFTRCGFFLVELLFFCTERLKGEIPSTIATQCPRTSPFEN